MPTTTKQTQHFTLARSVNSFGIDFLKAWNVQSRNVVFSPLCVELVLGMAWAGAMGETRRQLARVAHLAEGADLAALFADQSPAAAGGVEFHFANAFFVQPCIEARAGYLQILSSWWNSHLFALDFARDPNWAGARINQWVEAQTQGGIRQLIPPSALDSLTVAVLVSALHFKGLWADPFVEQATQREPFWLDRTTMIEVPMMHAEGRFNYAETPNCQVLELPYQGGPFSMLVCLPRVKDGLCCVEQALAATDVSRWLKAARDRKIQVSLPRFSVRMDGSIKEPIRALGLQTPFTTEADFRGITTIVPLWLSDVFHGAMIEVTEAGTVASAGCAACFGVTMCAPDMEAPVVFTADHPFLFALVHRESGVILFLGHVIRP